MKKAHKIALSFGAMVFTVFALSGCTANFCSDKDKAHILYAYDSGLAYDEKGNVTYDEEGVLQFKNEKVTTAIAKLGETYDLPSTTFWVNVDQKVYELAETAWQEDHPETAVPTDKKGKEEVLSEYGYLKFLGITEVKDKKGNAKIDKDTGNPIMEEKLWTNWDQIVKELRQELPEADMPGKDFIAAYKSNLTNYANGRRICITPVDGVYGPDGESLVIEGKSWRYAFKEAGFIEGLLVYPVAWLAHTFTQGFLDAGAGNGWSQFLAIFFVTLIVRGLLMIITFKSTLDQQRMTALQPELTKIQQKYPNSNTNQYEKQQMAQAQMALYKKHKINPFSQLLMLIVQFPIFIAVWGALSGSSILTSGSIFGMSLSSSIGSVLMKFNVKGGAWWTALVLFLLMSATQIVASKLPQWMQKKKMKNVSKMGKNPAADKTNKQMKWMSNIMIIMIVVMGFSLPSGMGFYWLFGALLSIAQTLITQTIMKRKKKA